MFGPPGHLYVYLSYGVHWCANVVCGPPGRASAVLLRALEPVAGVAAMRAARGSVADRDLCRGPGRLGQALGIDRSWNGADLATPGPLWLADDGVAPPERPCVTPRIGISVAQEDLLRFLICGHGGVSGRTSPSRGRM
jgi:DNA-3-methyladenine glycosylase